MLVEAMTVTRRSLLALAATSTFASWEAEAKTQDEVPPLALALIVAQRGDEPVVESSWLARQVSEAQRLMSAHGVSVGVVKQRTLGEAYARLENASERDALSSHLDKGVINAFFVERLRDVDRPDRFIRGVRWRDRRDLSKDYVIVASIAGPFTLCHELGHFLGNGHSQVVNNVMSYKHEDPAKVAFDARQGAKLRLVARQLLARKKVLSVADYEGPGDA